MKDKGIQLIDSNDAGELMDLKVNPVYDADGLIAQGVVIGNTLEQNKACILIAQPNDFKGNPTLGVGFQNVLLGDDLLEYRHSIRANFAMDGLKVTKLDLYNLENVSIIAHYEKGN